MKVLIVDDERQLVDALAFILKKNKITCDCAYDGEEAYEYGRTGLYDVILLDWMLPVMDGVTVLKKLRDEGVATPVIMLTAKDTPTDIVVGLELGASDYVTKPFNNQVLVARIRNQLRKTSTEQSLNTVTYKSLKVVEDEFRAELNDEPLDLTKTEFDILLLLVKHPGRVYTRGQMISSLKNGEYADITDRSVDVQILNLRRKLGDFASNIETIRGVGYRMQQLSGADR